MNRINWTIYATYATKEDLDMIVITVPIDFTKTEQERIAEIKDYLNPYIENDELFEIPMFARYIWNDNGVTRSYIVQGIPKLSGSFSMNVFASPLKIVIAEDPESAYSITTEIRYFNKKISVYFTPYNGEFDNNLLLEDDNDGIILQADGTDWQKLFDYLEIGLHPSICLKTTFSEVYVPASYDFVSTEEGKYAGSIILQYIKTIDGEKQIWIETKSFTQETGYFHGYNSMYQETTEKIPIPDVTFNFFILDKSEITSNWEENETIKETLKSQLRTFTNLNLPLCVIVNANNMKYYPEIIGSRNLFVDEDNYAIIFKVKWPKEFQYEIGCEQSQFSVGIGSFEAITDITNEFLPGLHTLFLYENNNYIIDASDFDPDNQLAKSINWQKWDDLLKAGIMPAVYLKSNLSEHYCLAEYKHFYNEVSQEYDTDVEIAYRKMVDGQLQLWIERRYFKGSIMNGYYDGENFEEHGLKLTKIPLK